MTSASRTGSIAADRAIVLAAISNDVGQCSFRRAKGDAAVLTVPHASFAKYRGMAEGLAQELHVAKLWVVVKHDPRRNGLYGHRKPHHGRGKHR